MFYRLKRSHYCSHRYLYKLVLVNNRWGPYAGCVCVRSTCKCSVLVVQTPLVWTVVPIVIHQGTGCCQTIVRYGVRTVYYINKVLCLPTHGTCYKYTTARKIFAFMCLIFVSPPEHLKSVCRPNNFLFIF